MECSTCTFCNRHLVDQVECKVLTGMVNDGHNGPPTPEDRPKAQLAREGGTYALPVVRQLIEAFRWY